MDADRIRQERPHLEVRVENTSYGLQPCILQSNYAFVDMDGGIGTALAEGTYVLVPLADLLDGPTDEDIRAGGARLCTPDAHVWNPLPEDFDSPPCISHFIEARAVLEAALMTKGG